MSYIKMCYSRKNVYERKRNVADIIEETPEPRGSYLRELKKDRDYYRLELPIIEAKIEKLEKLEKLYKQEYGI